MPVRDRAEHDGGTRDAESSFMSPHTSSFRVPLALAAIAGFAVFGCAHSADTSASTHAAPPPPSSTASSPADVQLSVGGRYFARDCTGCHGPSGEGTQTGPRIVGDGALPVDPPPGSLQRKKHFVTARDVYEFIGTHMPDDLIGQMPESYYWDTLAFLLFRNRIDLHGAVLDASDAQTIVLHAEP